MTHWRALQDSDYLRAVDLQGRELTLPIEKVIGGQVVGQAGKKSKKPLCYFQGKERPLGLNSTNCKTIAAMYGNDVENWAGKRITIYPTETNFGGETVECIRVRPQKPPGRPAKNETPRDSDPNEPPAERELPGTN